MTCFTFYRTPLMREWIRLRVFAVLRMESREQYFIGCTAGAPFSCFCEPLIFGARQPPTPSSRSATLFVNPESGFDSGFLHLTTFRADTGFQKAQETRCAERQSPTPSSRTVTLFVNPESGFDSGFLHLTTFSADTGFQKAQEIRREERQSPSWFQ